MKSKLRFLLGLSAGIFLSGCVTYPGIGTTEADLLEDTANKAFVAQQIATIAPRTDFKRNVKVQMSEKGNRFISAGVRPSGARQMTLTREFRKDLMATAHAALETEIGHLSDFNLISSDPAAMSDVPVISDADANNATYIFTYNISNVEVKDATATARVFISNRNVQKIRWFYVDVTVNVTLLDPAGKQVFNFEKSVTYSKGFPTPTPDISVVKDAVRHAIGQAMGNYVSQFAPPMYVDQTIGNGLFVRLSVGTNYGIRNGQRVIFYRNLVQTLPSIPGQAPKTQVLQQQLATGIVGRHGAPVDRDHAWVYVSGNDDPQKRKVFLWTSAKIAR